MPLSPCIELAGAEQTALLEIARLSIDSGPQGLSPPPVDLAGQPPALSERRGVFVTLLLGGSLRGCIGSMEADRAVAQAVAESAYGAAFRDPRFKPPNRRELDVIRIEISILSHMVELHPVDRTDLLTLLQPGTDGLLISQGRHRATFLPTVWKHLPEPQQFLEHLLSKAGLAADYWSDELRVQRYTTHTFCE